MQPWAFASKQFDDCKAYRIWSSWGPGCEDSVRPVIGGRCAHEFESLRAVEFPDDEQMGEPLDVSESGFKFRQNLQNADGLMLRAQAFGNFLSGFVGTADESNRVWSKHQDKDLDCMLRESQPARTRRSFLSWLLFLRPFGNKSAVMGRTA